MVGVRLGAEADTLDRHGLGVGHRTAPRTADAALFCAVHDVLQSPAALTHIFEHLRPGAAVAATGGKWPPPWNVALRAGVADLHAPFIHDFTASTGRGGCWPGSSPTCR